VPAAHLRIISDDLWRAAHAHLSTRRKQYGQFRKPSEKDGSARGRTRRDADAANLLTGFARCAICVAG
jgi:hypothetical protein